MGEVKGEEDGSGRGQMEGLKWKERSEFREDLGVRRAGRVERGKGEGEGEERERGERRREEEEGG